MKIILLLAAIVGLNSCNTMIGLGRDTKQGFMWSKNKIQESQQPEQSDESGEQVY